MITRQDIEDMGYEYYTPKTTSPEGDYKVRSTKEKAKVLCMTPMDMVQEFAKVTGQVPDADLYVSLIFEEIEEWVEENRPEQELKELSDLVYVLFGYANAKGWDLMEAVRRVHVNNLGRCVQDDGSVQRRADGKILKRQDYPKVDLSDLV
jgi:predicted HAD superfamily Cof-like phosphohydrolase